MVSLGQASMMVLGGVLALLIAHFYGRSLRTDAFFAAYGVYAIALVLGQTFRLTAIPRLVADRHGDAPARLVAAVSLIAAAAAIPMLLLADPLGALLVEHDPDGVAPAALRALWLALAGQLVAAMLAALLAVRGAFRAIGLGYLATGILSIAGFLALRPTLGIQGVSAALALSAAAVATGFGVALLRGHPRRRFPRLRFADVLGETGGLIAASATFVAANVGYVICVAIASRNGPGEATLYAYAFFTAALLVAVTAASAAMVRSPTLLSEGGSGASAAAHAVTTYRYTLLIVLPVLALAALVGGPLVDIVLGKAFDTSDGNRLVVTLLCLSGWVLASAAAVYAIVELLGRRRISLLAAIAVGQIVLLPALALGGRELAGIEGIAAAQSLAMVAATAIQIRLAFESAWRTVTARIARATAAGVTAIGAACVPAIVLLVLDDSTPARLAAAVLFVALFPLAARLVWPQETRVLMSLLRRRAQPAAPESDQPC